MCSISKENVFDAISTVIDPEVGFNLVEMGLIYDAIIEEENCDVKVIMTLYPRVSLASDDQTMGLRSSGTHRRCGCY
jgi:hypothetical protein